MSDKLNWFQQAELDTIALGTPNFRFTLCPHINPDDNPDILSLKFINLSVSNTLVLCPDCVNATIGALVGDIVKDTINKVLWGEAPSIAVGKPVREIQQTDPFASVRDRIFEPYISHEFGGSINAISEWVCWKKGKPYNGGYGNGGHVFTDRQSAENHLTILDRTDPGAFEIIPYRSSSTSS